MYQTIKKNNWALVCLLETVDLEFERVLTERDKYKENIATNSPIENDEEKLNVDLLCEILRNYFPEIRDSDNTFGYSDLLNELYLLKFDTVDKLSSLVNQYKVQLMLEQKEISL